MSRSVLFVLALLFLLVAPTAVAGPFGQSTPDPFEEVEVEGVEDGVAELDTTALDYAAIEDVLAVGEAARAGHADGYEAGTRRDPFNSLEMSTNVVPFERDCPAGSTSLSLLVDEIEIQGVFELADGAVAQVTPTRQTVSILIRPGDQLCDGEVVSISLGEVVFRQAVPPGPGVLRPWRDVLKKLGS